MAEAIGRSFTSQTLAVGETIRLTFDFTWSSGIASGNAQIFRIGLFDVTNAITADNWSDSNAIGASAGYYTFVRDGNATGNIARQESYAEVTSTVGPTNGGGTAYGMGSNTTNYNMPNGTAYQGLFEVTYVSATQIDTLFTLSTTIDEITTNHFSVSGTQDINVENSGSLVTSFDTVVMKAGANTATITLDNVQLTVIPEPSAAVLGAFGVLALLRRRRN